MIRSIMFVLEQDVPGMYNVAGDGVLPWSEVAAISGKRTLPLPPFGLGRRLAALARVGLDLPARGARAAALRPRRRQPAG